jgi:hypothetical protein
MPDVTRILSAFDAGNPRAAEQLLPLVYDELRRLAAAKMRAAITSPAGTCGDAIVATSPRISSPPDGWFGIAGEQFYAGCWVEWRERHGWIARSGLGRRKSQ